VLILSLDTTTVGGSCALCVDDVVVREHATDPAVSQAERLPADLMTLLETHGSALADIDAFAVGTGPGSFTGLRVGIAAMQGLAFAMEKPLVGISAFDALAYLAHSGTVAADVPATADTVTATWIDAWRGEVFSALYQNEREAEPPTVEPPARILTRLNGRRILFTGDGASVHADQIRERLGSAAVFTCPVAPALAGAIGILAARELAAGHRPLPHAIRPLYVRRSDAELARDRR
jgi:tRNA threonylcarbamoyladenosine biosynthesis protein TsaB